MIFLLNKSQFSVFIVNFTSSLVSLAAVFSIVTQRSYRDDTKNGCEGDYIFLNRLTLLQIISYLRELLFFSRTGKIYSNIYNKYK